MSVCVRVRVCVCICVCQIFSLGNSPVITGVVVSTSDLKTASRAFLKPSPARNLLLSPGNLGKRLTTQGSSSGAEWEPRGGMEKRKKPSRSVAKKSCSLGCFSGVVWGTREKKIKDEDVER